MLQFRRHDSINYPSIIFLMKAQNLIIVMCYNLCNFMNIIKDMQCVAEMWWLWLKR